MINKLHLKEGTASEIITSNDITPATQMNAIRELRFIHFL